MTEQLTRAAQYDGNEFIATLRHVGATTRSSAQRIEQLPEISAQQLAALIELGIVREGLDGTYYAPERDAFRDFLQQNVPMPFFLSRNFLEQKIEHPSLFVTAGTVCILAFVAVVALVRLSR